MMIKLLLFHSGIQHHVLRDVIMLKKKKSKSALISRATAIATHVLIQRIINIRSPNKAPIDGLWKVGVKKFFGSLLSTCLK